LAIGRVCIAGSCPAVPTPGDSGLTILGLRHFNSYQSPDSTFPIVKNFFPVSKMSRLCCGLGGIGVGTARGGQRPQTGKQRWVDFTSLTNGMAM
jgi:hypothetical protein